MSIYSPGLVLWDYEPERTKNPGEKSAIRRSIADGRERIGQWQVVIPQETASRFLKTKQQKGV